MLALHMHHDTTCRKAVWPPRGGVRCLQESCLATMRGCVLLAGKLSGYHEGLCAACRKAVWRPRGVVRCIPQQYWPQVAQNSNPHKVALQHRYCLVPPSMYTHTGLPHPKQQPPTSALNLTRDQHSCSCCNSPLMCGCK
jgi:hypothetical protein